MAEKKLKNNGRRIQIVITEKGLSPLKTPLKRPVKAVFMLLDYALKQGYISDRDIYYYALTSGGKVLFKVPTQKELIAQRLTAKMSKAV